MSIKIYHNPRCSKSRETLALLKARGIEPEVIEYLKHPPSRAELDDILRWLNKEPREIMRKQEAEYKAQGLDDPELSREALCEALIASPKLLERPIVVTHQQAAIGRPPEAILAIL